MCDKCECSHSVDYGACSGFMAGFNGRCVFCDHAELCHPGVGPVANGPLSPVRIDTPARARGSAKSEKTKQKIVRADRSPLNPNQWSCDLECGQVDTGQTGEYPCEVCGLPFVHDNEICFTQPAQAEGDAP